MKQIQNIIDTVLELLENSDGNDLSAADARKSIAEAVKITDTLPPDEAEPFLVQIYSILGGLCADGNNPQEAIEYYRKALDIYKRGDFGAELILDTLNTLGALCYEINDFERSFRLYTEAAAVSEKLSPESVSECASNVADTYSGLAAYHLDKEEYDDAEKLYKKSLDTCGLAKTADEDSVFELDESRAAIYYQMGLMYGKLNKMAEAEKYYNLSLDIYKKNPDGERTDVNYDNLATAFNGLATLYGEWGDNEKSLEYMQKAKSLYTYLAKKNHVYDSNLAMLLSNMGLLYCNMEEYRYALEELTDSLEIYSRLEEESYEQYMPEAVLTYMNLGVLYISTEEYEQAISYLEPALDRYDRLVKKFPEKYRADKATVQSNLGVAYMYTGDIKRAEKVLLESLKVRGELALKYPAPYNPDLADTYTNLATLYTLMEKEAKAVKAYKEALSITEALAEAEPERYYESLAGIYQGMGILYSNNEKTYKSAIVYFKKALYAYGQAADDDMQSYMKNAAGINTMLAKVYAGMGQYQVAEEIYTSVIHMYGALDDSPDYAYETMLNFLFMADAQEQQDKLEQAEKSMEMAYKILKNGKIPSGHYEEWMDILKAIEDDME